MKLRHGWYFHHWFLWPTVLVESWHNGWLLKLAWGWRFLVLYEHNPERRARTDDTAPATRATDERDGELRRII